jgi:hypothetical protein
MGGQTEQGGKHLRCSFHFQCSLSELNSGLLYMLVCNYIRWLT